MEDLKTEQSKANKAVSDLSIIQSQKVAKTLAFWVLSSHGKQEELSHKHPEMVTLSRAKYESQQAQLTELKLQNQ